MRCPDSGKPPIHKDMTVSELLASRPELSSVLRHYRMRCPSCMAGQVETLQSVAQAHGIEVESLLRDLNVASLMAAGGECQGNGEEEGS